VFAGCPDLQLRKQKRAVKEGPQGEVFKVEETTPNFVSLLKENTGNSQKEGIERKKKDRVGNNF